MTLKPILVRLPPELDALLEERRGEATRSAFMVSVLMQYMGLDQMTTPIPKRGRPKKPRQTDRVAGPEPEMPPVDIPEVPTLCTVRWKDIQNEFPWHADREAPKTLYVSDDGNYVRFAYKETTSSTGKAIINIIKAHGGYWNKATGWPITSPEVLDAVKARAENARQVWAIRPMADLILDEWEFAKLTLQTIASDLVLLTLDRAALIEAGRKWPAETRAFMWHMAEKTSVPWVYAPDDKNSLVSLPMGAAEVAALVDHLENVRLVTIQRTQASSAEQRAWARQPIIAEPDIGLVHARLALGNPMHRLLLGHSAKAIKPGDHVGSEITVPADAWLDIADHFTAVGGTIQERTGGPARFSADVDPTGIPGWEWPAKNGYRFFAHQRDGIRFLIDRQCRALVCDEMGLGKTGTAIGAAEAVGAKRVLVIAPANARWVWDREIRGWADAAEIIHIEETLQEISDLPPAAWVIATYDVVTSRTEQFIPPNAETAAWLRDELLSAGYYRVLALARGMGEASASDLAEADGAVIAVSYEPFRFDARMTPDIGNVLRNLIAPANVDSKVVARLNRMGRRISSELLRRLLEWDPDLVLVDEAHRIKNRDAGRTRAVRALIEDRSRGAVLLTGTPLRNHAGEGASLIDAILPGAKDRLAKSLSKGYWRDARKAAGDKAIGEILKAVMIRRLKADVLDLPPKMRQWLDIDVDAALLDDYHDAMAAAAEMLDQRIASGSTQGEAGNAVMGMLSKARRLLGLAKIANPAVADLIDDVVDAKGGCLVFAHHRDVVEGIADQLRALGRSVVVVHGETPSAARSTAETDFQAGRADVFVGSINAAGEALTLTRADTCVFVEMDWVPAAARQQGWPD